MCGGWDPVGDVKKLVEDPVGTIASAIVNVSTGGLVGVEDGQLTTGAAINAAKEGIGEITGANAARKAAMDMEAATKAAMTEQEKQRQFNLQQQEARERQLSLAGGSGKRNSSTGTGGSGMSQQLATDFLGL